jgi:hypothetical protein
VEVAGGFVVVVGFVVAERTVAGTCTPTGLDGWAEALWLGADRAAEAGLDAVAVADGSG